MTTQAPNPTGGGAQNRPAPTALKGAFSFMPVTSEKKSKYMNVLIYGIQGGGKTTMAGSACNIDEASDVLLVTAEGGDLVFDSNDRITRPHLIDMVRVTRIEQLQKIYEWLTYHIKARDSNDETQLRRLQNIVFFGDANITREQALEMHPDFDYDRIRRFKTIILDSLTDIEAQNMANIMGVADKGFDVGEDLNPAGYTEFRKNNNSIQQLVRSFRNLDIHFIAICGQKYAKDEIGRFHYTPWMTGQLATQIQSFFDVVGYMVVSNADPSKPDVRRLYVQPQAAVKFDAKCRIASLKTPMLEDPLFADLLRAAKFL